MPLSAGLTSKILADDESAGAGGTGERDMVAEFENVPAMPRINGGGEASCAGIGPYLSAYADGEISASDRQVVDAHLARCESCRRDLAAFGFLDAAAPHVPVPEMAEECFDAALDVLRRRMGGKGASGAAAAALDAGDAAAAKGATGGEDAAGVGRAAGVAASADGCVPLSLGDAARAAEAFPVPVVDDGRWARVWSNIASRTVASSGEKGAAAEDRAAIPRAAPPAHRPAASRWQLAAGLLAAACAAITLSLMPQPQDPGPSKGSAAEAFDEDEAEAVSPRYQLIVRRRGKDDAEGESPPVVCFVLKQ